MSKIQTDLDHPLENSKFATTDVILIPLILVTEILFAKNVNKIPNIVLIYHLDHDQMMSLYSVNQICRIIGVESMYLDFRLQN